MAKRGSFRVNRVYCFFALFCFVYFLESIGGVYMISAVQSIERQFQIPSKMSGLMISAGDFGYIPTVVFISYMGSKGNRARWIGGGCLLIAFANFLIATPNFIFNNSPQALNMTVIKERLSPPASLAFANVTPEALLGFAPIRERMSNSVHDQLLAKLRAVGSESSIEGIDGAIKRMISEESESAAPRTRRNTYYNGERVSVNESVINEGTRLVKEILENGENATVFFEFLKSHIRQMHNDSVEQLTMSMGAPFGYCSVIVNEVRQKIQDLKCATDQTNTGPFAVIFIALLFLGVGRTMPWSLGVPLIDDNVKRKNLPVYFAGMFFIRILGPILGFLIGSACNKLHYTLKDPIGLSPKDPTWIGAWWLGFLVIFAVLFGPSLGLFFFPHKPASDDVEEVDGADEKLNGESAGAKLNGAPPKKKRSLALVDRHARKTDDGKALVPESFDGKVKDFISSIKIVLKSPVYTGALVGRIIDVLAFKGFIVFWPKYLETHFGIPQYLVQLLLAVFGVVGFAIGMLGGSAVMRIFKLEGRKAAMFVAICSLLAATTSFTQIGLGCTSVINRVGQIGKTNNFNFTTSCNEHCMCETAPLFPVCDRNGTAYYSPCHAGCTEVELIDQETNAMTFSNCSCASSGEVHRDWCTDDCALNTKLYFIVGIISGIIGGLGVIPGVMIILRSVPPEHRSISLGFSGFLVSLFATLPSPVMWGYLIDSACLLWEKTCSGDNGSCRIYDPTELRNRIHIFYGVLRLIALTTDVWVWYFARGLKLMADEEEEQEENHRDRHIEGAEAADLEKEKNAKELEVFSG